MGLIWGYEAKSADFPAPAQYATIQAAINAANNDDTVYVAPGRA
ncbi:MAG: hypothetical protein AB1630_11400 [bacterium]